MPHAVRATAGWAVPGVDPLHAIRRSSAACAAQQLSQTAATGGAALRHQRPRQGQAHSYAAAAAAAPPVTAAPPSAAVTAMPVRPDQPGLGTVSLRCAAVASDNVSFLIWWSRV